MRPCFSFFFSSRRRHTRSLRDWSSDVCSSDLTALTSLPAAPPSATLPPPRGKPATRPLSVRWRWQIGRASCRERVWISRVGVFYQGDDRRQRRVFADCLGLDLQQHKAIDRAGG